MMVAAAVTAIVAAGPGVAFASWAGGGSGSGSSKAVSMPAGSTPTVVRTGRNVTVSWSASTLPGPTAVDGYVVSRRDAGTNAAQTVGASCSSTIAALTCTESGVDPGTWYYTVRPKKAAWLGAASAASANVTVPAPSLSFTSSTTMSTLPSTLSGSVAGFLTGESLTFRLDDPSTGTVLSGSTAPSSIPANGQASVSVTIPAGTANGTHTVYAVGSSGSQPSAGVTVAVDVANPSVDALTIAKATGYSSGYLKQGGTYYVYANVSDPSPSSGIATVTANVANVTTGSTAVSLIAGTYSVDGVSYGYRSASLTANAGLTAGAKAFSVTATDGVGHTATGNGSVNVDNTAPSATDVQSADGGGTVGKIEVNDSFTYTFSEPIDPLSVLAGWSGTATPVTLRFTNANPDYILVYDATNTTLLPLNRLNLGNKKFLTAGGTGSGSMVMSGSSITVTVTGMGAATSQVAAATTMSWGMNAGMYDRAGNACPSATVNQSGGPKANF